MAYFTQQSYSFVPQCSDEDLVPDARGALSPAQVVDAKFFALVGSSVASKSARRSPSESRQQFRGASKNIGS